MKFKGAGKFKCKCVKIKQDGNQFKITVDKKKLKAKDAGIHKLEVELRDSDYKYSRKSNKYTISLNIKKSSASETTDVTKSKDVSNSTKEATATPTKALTSDNATDVTTKDTESADPADPVDSADSADNATQKSNDTDTTETEATSSETKTSDDSSDDKKAASKSDTKVKKATTDTFININTNTQF